ARITPAGRDQDRIPGTQRELRVLPQAARGRGDAGSQESVREGRVRRRLGRGSGPEWGRVVPTTHAGAQHSAAVLAALHETVRGQDLPAAVLREKREWRIRKTRLLPPPVAPRGRAVLSLRGDRLEPGRSS